MTAALVGPPGVLAPSGAHALAAWRLCETPAQAVAVPSALASIVPAGEWVVANCPGTAAAALAHADRFDITHPRPLHDHDIWYQTEISGQGAHLLRLDGLATVADVFLDDVPVGHHQHMFAPLQLALELGGTHTLSIAFRSLHGHIRGLKLPRARWRVAMVEDASLRGVRTTLLGHMPSWCPPVHTVGPWKAAWLLNGPCVAVEHLRAQLLPDGNGLVDLTVRTDLDLSQWHMAVNGQHLPLTSVEAGTWQASVTVDAPTRWWPRYMGPQHRYPVSLVAQNGTHWLLGQVGFRTLRCETGPDGKGFALVVNDTPVFARGAVWTPPDLLAPGHSARTRERLTALADMGANMVRLAGPFCYEDTAFFDACDELGLLVWHDLMLANFDYPLGDEGFRTELARELDAQIRPLAAHPCLAVLCGGSEVMQQAAMLGLGPDRWAHPFYTEELGQWATRNGLDAVVVPNSPYGGELPFSVREGVTHYFGVGAYERPLTDARRAAPRFATECLAFAQVPEPCSLHDWGAMPVHDPRWKAGVPRDRHASWDFEDTRDHYLSTLFGTDAALLRRTDLPRYLHASRATVAHVLSQTMGEWRRPASPTRGALVFTASDLRPGAGWGLVAVDGEPKSGWYGLRAVCGPVVLLLSDEGSDGVDIHLVNDTPDRQVWTISVKLLRQGQQCIAQGEAQVQLLAHGAATIAAHTVLGGFADLTYAFRFGPPSHDAVVVSAKSEHCDAAALQAVFFPMGLCLEQHTLGLTATVVQDDAGWLMDLRCLRLATFVHIDDPRWLADENWFHLAPHESKRIRFRARSSCHAEDTPPPSGEIRALNGVDIVLYKGEA